LHLLLLVRGLCEFLSESSTGFQRESTANAKHVNNQQRFIKPGCILWVAGGWGSLKSIKLKLKKQTDGKIKIGVERWIFFYIVYEFWNDSVTGIQSSWSFVPTAWKSYRSMFQPACLPEREKKIQEKPVWLTDFQNYFFSHFRFSVLSLESKQKLGWSIDDTAGEQPIRCLSNDMIGAFLFVTKTRYTRYIFWSSVQRK